MNVSCIVRNIVPFSLGLVLAVPGARSQAAPHTIAEANIPFAFQYSGKTLPPGKYQIRTFQSGFMVLEGSKGTVVGQVRREDALRAEEPAKLIFRAEGTDVVLQDVWVPNMNAHMVCSPARQPKRQDLARSAAAPSTVTVALVENPR